MAAVDEAFTGHRVTFFVEVFDNIVSCLFNENMEMLLHSLTAGLVTAAMWRCLYLIKLKWVPAINFSLFSVQNGKYVF